MNVVVRSKLRNITLWRLEKKEVIMATKMFAFVYGTLKRGEPNHYWLTETANGSGTFVGTGVTQNIYPLVIASRYNIPFLIDKQGTGKNIHGELYEIDEKMLANLDILEEYPKLYTRREEPILMTSPGSENGQVVKMAWTYFLSDFRQELLNLPYIDCYRNGINNLEYVTSEDDLADAKDI